MFYEFTNSVYFEGSIVIKKDTKCLSFYIWHLIFAGQLLFYAIKIVYSAIKNSTQILSCDEF